jgi:hypothetical protein
MVKINTFAEWWSGLTSADRQGQNTVRGMCCKQFCLFWLPRAVDFKVSCSQIPRRAFARIRTHDPLVEKMPPLLSWLSIVTFKCPTSMFAGNSDTLKTASIKPITTICANHGTECTKMWEDEQIGNMDVFSYVFPEFL